MLRLQLNLDPGASFCYKRKRKNRFLVFLIGLGTRLASAKRKEVNEKPDEIMSWYWKWKPTWRKSLIAYNSHPRIMFPFNWLVIVWREGGFAWNWTSKVNGVEELGGGEGVRCLQNWPIFMDFIVYRPSCHFFWVLNFIKIGTNFNFVTKVAQICNFRLR